MLKFLAKVFASKIGKILIETPETVTTPVAIAIKESLIKGLDKANFYINRGQELRNRGLKVQIGGQECYQKCRDEDDVAISSIIFSMESLGENVKHNYRMFKEEGYSFWCSPTLEELKTIKAQCFNWVSNVLYSEIKRIELEILALDKDTISNYEVEVSQ